MNFVCQFSMSIYIYIYMYIDKASEKKRNICDFK